jgi:hypothetical protein
MAAVSETIVREYFELHGFFVRQQRKYVPHTKSIDEAVDFFVINPKPQPANEPLPFVLSSEHVRSLTRAVVAVRGWHTESFTPGVLSHAPEILRFVEPTVFQKAAKAFGAEDAPAKVLVVPELPQDPAVREQSIALLRGRGVDAAIPFQVMLTDLIGQVEVNRNYQKSDLLQVIRILKIYGYFKEPQLELFKQRRRPSASRRRGRDQSKPPEPQVPGG